MASRAVSINTRMWPSGVRSSLRDRGEELALIGDLLLYPAGHVVDRIGEHAHLAAGVTEVETGVELALTDIARGLDHEDQRPGQPPGDPTGRAPQHGEHDDELPPRRPTAAQPEADIHAGAERDAEPPEDPASHPSLEPPRAPHLASRICARHISFSA